MSHVNMWQHVHSNMGVTYAHMQLTFPPNMDYNFHMWIFISYIYLSNKELQSVSLFF